MLCRPPFHRRGEKTRLSAAFARRARLEFSRRQSGNATTASPLKGRGLGMTGEEEKRRESWATEGEAGEIRSGRTR